MTFRRIPMVRARAWYRRLIARSRSWLRWPRQVELTVSERYPHWPEIASIRNEHIVDARLHANRKSLIASLPIPQGGKIAEIGVFKGEFSTFLIEILKPRQFFGFDSFAMHKWANRRGITGKRLFEGLTHRQYYERAMAKFGDIAVPVEGLTAQTLRGYTDRSFDLVYVDAGHSYAEVKADAACAVEMVSEAGFLVFNDYTLITPGTYAACGVVPVVNDLVVNHGWIFVGYALEEYLFCDIALRRA
jgi:methyltransferase family protein